MIKRKKRALGRTRNHPHGFQHQLHQQRGSTMTSTKPHNNWSALSSSDSIAFEESFTHHIPHRNCLTSVLKPIQHGGGGGRGSYYQFTPNPGSESNVGHVRKVSSSYESNATSSSWTHTHHQQQQQQQQQQHQQQQEQQYLQTSQNALPLRPNYNQIQEFDPNKISVNDITTSQDDDNTGYDKNSYNNLATKKTVHRKVRVPLNDISNNQEDQQKLRINTTKSKSINEKGMSSNEMIFTRRNQLSSSASALAASSSSSSSSSLVSSSSTTASSTFHQHSSSFSTSAKQLKSLLKERNHVSRHRLNNTTTDSTSHTTSNHIMNQKKIQWDQSILDRTRDLDDDDAHKIKPVRFTCTRRKRYDELLQYDVQNGGITTTAINNSSSGSMANQLKYTVPLPEKEDPLTSINSLMNECSSGASSTNYDTGESTENNWSSYASSTSSIELNSKDSTGTNDEIAECVQDILDQTRFAPAHIIMIDGNQVTTPKDLYSKISNQHQQLQSIDMSCSMNKTNITAEIAECVGDIKNQSMASECFMGNDRMKMLTTKMKKTSTSVLSSNADNNTTFEVTECVADVLEQSIASRSFRSRHSFDVDNSALSSHQYIIKECPAFDFSTTNISNSTWETSDCVIQKGLIESGGSMSLPSRNDTVTTVAIAECVADVLEQSRISENVMIDAQSSEYKNASFKREKRLLQVVNTPLFSPIKSTTIAVKSAYYGNDESIVPRLDGSSVSYTSTVLNEMANDASSGTSTSSYLSCQSFEMQNRDESIEERSPDISANLIKIGISLLTAKQFNESILTFKEALRIRQKRCGYDHPLVAKIHNNLGVAYLNLGRYEEGLASFQNALNSHNNALQMVIDSDDTKKDDYLVKKFDLEIADMLCNVGSVCLDWLDKDPTATKLEEKAKLSQKAEHAFSRSMTIQLHYLSYQSSQVHETQKMYQEAQNLSVFFKDQIHSSNTKAPTYRRIESQSNTNGRFPKYLHSHDSELDEENCLISLNEYANCPYDEYTLPDFPSDEASFTGPFQMDITMLESAGSSNEEIQAQHFENGYQSPQFSLFSKGLLPSGAQVIDSDTKKMDDDSFSVGEHDKSEHFEFQASVIPTQFNFSGIISPIRFDQINPDCKDRSISTTISTDTQMKRYLSSIEMNNSSTLHEIEEEPYEEVNEVTPVKSLSIHRGETSNINLSTHHKSNRILSSVTDNIGLGQKDDAYEVSKSDFNPTTTYAQEDEQTSSPNVFRSYSNCDEEICPLNDKQAARKQEGLSEDILLSRPEKYSNEIRNVAERCVKVRIVTCLSKFFSVIFSILTIPFCCFFHSLGRTI